MNSQYFGGILFLVFINQMSYKFLAGFGAGYIFSHRDEFGQWDPKNQRPELWNIFNGRKNFGKSFRIFPISNWTEMDIWLYVLQEKIELPSIYFAHEREVFERDGVIMAASEFIPMKDSEKVGKQIVRFRTIGDIPLAIVGDHSFRYLTDDYRPRKKGRRVKIDPVFEDRTTILYYYPGNAQCHLWQCRTHFQRISSNNSS